MLDRVKETPTFGTEIGTKCNACDENFQSVDEFKEHILTTVHNGPANGTRNFTYKLTAKTAKNNLIKELSGNTWMFNINRGL